MTILDVHVVKNDRQVRKTFKNGYFHFLNVDRRIELFVRLPDELLDKPVFIQEYGSRQGNEQDARGKGNVKKDPAQNFQDWNFRRKYKAKMKPNG